MKKLLFSLFFLFSIFCLNAGVKITTGEYVCDETDIEKGAIQKLTVKREYRSATPVVGSFGIGWSTNLDERIIICVSPPSEELYDILVRIVDMRQSIVSQYEESIKESYEVDDPYKVVEELKGRQERVVSIKNELIGLKDELLGMQGFMPAGSEDERLITENIESCDKGIEDADKKFEELDESIKEAQEVLGKLEGVQKQLDEDTNKKIKMEEEITISNIRKERNKKAMFKGMESWYEETGIETIQYIDDQGYPNLMYESKKYKDAWEPESGEYLCYYRNGNYFIEDTSGQTKVFDFYGFLVKIIDRYGNQINIIRDEDEKISSIKSSFGESFTVEYENSFIKSITNDRDPSEKCLYFYDGERMTGITDSDGDFVSYGYNEFGLLDSMNKNDGSCYRILYDDKILKGSLVATALVNEDGNAQRFEFNFKERITVFIDRDGNRTIYYYDKNQKTIKEEYEYASEDYVPQNNKTEDSNTKGIQQYDDLVYDQKNNVLELKNKGKTVYKYTFNSKGQVIAFYDSTEGKGVTHTYEYDSFGNRIKDSTSKKNAIVMEYDARNRLVRVKQNKKVILNIAYENNGKITRRTYSNGLVIEIEQNGRKDIIRMTITDTKTGKKLQTEVEYNRHHIPLNVYKGDGTTRKLVKTFTYTDQDWMIMSEIDGVKKTYKPSEKKQTDFEDLWDIPDFNDSIYFDSKAMDELKASLF